MGYAFCVGSCFCCKRTFTFNPVRVPSYQGEPICQICITYVNTKKVEMGMKPFTVPVDAYEACKEEEL